MHYLQLTAWIFFIIWAFLMLLIQYWIVSNLRSHIMDLQKIIKSWEKFFDELRNNETEKK